MITSKTNPKIKNVVKLQKVSERREQNLFVVEGRREIERLQACGFEIDTLFICPEIVAETIQIKAQTTEYVSEDVFRKIAYREGGDGLLALAIPKYHELKSLKLKKNPLILILESVEKPGNLGAIMRTADAAGVDAVIICDSKTDIFNPNTVRSSVGSLFSIPVIACTTKECIDWLRENEIQILCTYLDASIDYLDADFTKPTAIVFGTEANGLSDEWIREADQNIIIEMDHAVADSLNVSVSVAIVVFEAVRQRKKTVK
jgi:TrmH family RNA methyltransferase